MNSQKEQLVDEMRYRKAGIPAKDGVPASLDEEGRSVEAVGASEAPVLERDFKTWEILPTILLMRGCELPENGQLPLLDNHSRWGSSSVIGSYRDVRIEGDKLIGRAVFTSSNEVEPIWTRVREGHITDLSVGRVDLAAPVVVPEGQTATVEGRKFTGPVRVVTRWRPKEMSVTPIGADATAKVRSANLATPQTINDQHEENSMADEQTRAAGAAPTPPAAPVQPTPQSPTPAMEQRADTDNGFARALDIMELCNRHGLEGEQRAAMLKPEVTMDQARSMVLEALAQRSVAHHPGFAPSGLQVQVDERDKFRAAACTGMFLRCGLPLDGERGLAATLEGCGWKVDRAQDVGRDFIGYSLREVARECLRKAGQSVGGDPMEMVGRAMTVSDLPVLMSNVANKALFEGYASAEETWKIWADGTGSVPDFKQNTLAMVSEFDDLEEIKNDTGYKYGDRGDAKEVYQIATFGKLGGITRTTVINDDLMGMADMYMSMGEAASRKIGDCAYGVLTANAAMRDGVALFHANHKNLGTPGVLGEATIAEAIKLARLQNGLKGKQRLNIPLMYFIGPASIEGSAEIFFASNQFSADDKGSTRTNIYGGTRFQRAYDARLDEASPTAYYFAGPKRKTVRLFFLNGNRTPWLEAKTGWTTDGVEYKVRIDVCGKAVDWKAMVKNAGG